MKRIQLNSRSNEQYFALVDDEDYEYLNQFNWHLVVRQEGSMHVQKSLQGITVYMHSLILKTSTLIDHKNRDGLDNQKHNLRLANKSQNGANRTKQINNTSGYKGVYWFKRDHCWRAMIQFKGTIKHLGYFVDKITAAKAYNDAATKYFGEFARLNEI